MNEDFDSLITGAGNTRQNDFFIFHVELLTGASYPQACLACDILKSSWEYFCISDEFQRFSVALTEIKFTSILLDILGFLGSVEQLSPDLLAGTRLLLGSGSCEVREAACVLLDSVDPEWRHIVQESDSHFIKLYSSDEKKVKNALEKLLATCSSFTLLAGFISSAWSKARWNQSAILYENFLENYPVESGKQVAAAFLRSDSLQVIRDMASEKDTPLVYEMGRYLRSNGYQEFNAYI